MENALNKGTKGIWIGVDLGTTNSTGEYLSQFYYKDSMVDAFLKLSNPHHRKQSRILFAFQIQG